MRACFPVLLVVGLLLSLATPVAAQSKRPACGKPSKPELQYRVEVPVTPGATSFVRHAVMTRGCSARGWASWIEHLVVDERGKILASGGGEIIPLSARHAVQQAGFGRIRVVVYGKTPGPELPYLWPGRDRSLLPGADPGAVADRPVMVGPIVVGYPVVGPGDSTTVTMALFTGDSLQPKLVSGLGGRAVFGVDRFGQGSASGGGIGATTLVDAVMPRAGSVMFQNFTAPDGTGLAQVIDRNGEPISAPIGLVEVFRYPHGFGRHGGRNSPWIQLASRVAPLGPDFPGMWLYMPLDREGRPVAPLEGSVGYTVLRQADDNDAVLWGAVYRSPKGYQVAFGPQADGRLPGKVPAERYTALRFFDLDNYVKSYSGVGRLTSGEWAVVQTHWNGPRQGAPNRFASAQAATDQVHRWQAQYDAEAKRREEAWRTANQARLAREAEQARQAELNTFEAGMAQSGTLVCYTFPLQRAAPLGDQVVRRWYERCDVPLEQFANARRLGVPQAVFDRSLENERLRQENAARLRAMGARSSGFADAMAAYRTTAGAAPADPWVAVRVTEGGRTTTRVMRQSEYDRRRP
ncbi:hypothetical protein [Caulobacter sp. NIBR1757]|uniref:hypothetical protein n=1 Tax=Caulobacter sp. NIBR1757 TaxID=3016000 RepID=UPI0022F140C7|nr:hypothetical protein [Caulobacter sp. NIBR1757]WGM40869.1 hypothetical protein AMEJIAPC_03816 [Caulobacter sp. NIBR1757]